MVHQYYKHINSFVGEKLLYNTIKVSRNTDTYKYIKSLKCLTYYATFM